VSKRRLQIAISCDGEAIPHRHFGDCPEFRIYEIFDDGTYRLLEKKLNTSPEERKHADKRKLKGVIGMLPGCEVVISGQLSPNFLRMRKGLPVQPSVTTARDIESLLGVLKDSFDALFNLVTARRRGEYPAEIPTLG
jgi:predicted Fe-Mo cluster-binding NifX family protein